MNASADARQSLPPFRSRSCPESKEIVVHQIRKHLTYANVMSSLAVFLILGGATALAATKIDASQLKANSVKTGKIVKEAVTTSKIKNEAIGTTKIANEAVTTAKLQNNAVTGAKVADGSLSSADLASGTLTPTCPGGTVLSQGVCFETGERATVSFEAANETCVAAGRRLPHAAELSGFTKKVQVIPASEWSGDLFSTTQAFTVKPDGTFVQIAFATPTAFRCIATPTP
jgi:hypothetical protein